MTQLTKEWLGLQQPYFDILSLQYYYLMIRIAFTLANNIAKHFRFSPTAIIEGRQIEHLETLVARQQYYESTRLAEQQAFNAKIQNIASPYEREKEQIIYEFSDIRSSLNFEDAWLKIDEVEQRQSDQIWKDFTAHKK